MTYLPGGPSRLAALLLPQIRAVFSVVAPCQPGAALRNIRHESLGQDTSSTWSDRRFAAENPPHREPAPARGKPHLRRSVGGLRGAPLRHPARISAPPMRFPVVPDARASERFACAAGFQPSFAPRSDKVRLVLPSICSERRPGDVLSESPAVRPESKPEGRTIPDLHEQPGLASSRLALRGH